MDHLERLRFQRLVEHLHSLGARAVAELLLDLAQRTGSIAFLLDRLAAHHWLSPELVRAVGGDVMPRGMPRLVPAKLRRQKP